MITPSRYNHTDLTPLDGFIIQAELKNSTESRAIIQCKYMRYCQIVYRSLDDIKKPLPENERQFIPIGSVEFANEFAIQQLGVHLPNNEFPDSLRHFYQRPIYKTTSGQLIRQMRSHQIDRLFTKPVETKKFNGAVMTLHEFQQIILDKDSEIYYSKPVRFAEEYRVYVQNQNILGIAQYKGENDLDLDHENVQTIQTIINNYKNQPAAYALDVGFIQHEYKKKLAIVEINRSWGTGFYPNGIKAIDYGTWIKSGWITRDAREAPCFSRGEG